MLQRFSSFSLDTANQCIWRGEQRIQLAPKSYAVLSCLIKHAGRIVTKEELLEAAWPSTFVQEAVLKTCILEIRKALGENPKDPKCIATIHRRGYRFDDRPAEPTAAPTSETSTSTLVGRASELRQIRRLWTSAAEGARQVGFVVGDAGIGKSTLISHFIREVSGEATLRILRGQCIEHLAASEAYYPIFDALGRMAKAGTIPGFVDILRNYAPTWLVQLPGLASAEDRELLKQETLGATRDRMLREMCEAVEMLSRDGPLLLLIEDLHWSDVATLDLISSMASRTESARLLILLSYRPVDVVVTNHPVRAVKQSLVMQRKCAEIELELLNRHDVANLLQAQFPMNDFPEGFADVLHERTDGNPLFLANVVDFAISSGVIAEINDEWRLRDSKIDFSSWVPENMAQMLETQIERLTAREQTMLEIASVVGVRFAVPLLAGDQADELLAAETCCDGMSRRMLFIREAGLAEFGPGQMCAEYQFRHALYRDVFYRRLSPVRRIRLHRLIGERLEAAAGGRMGESASELAIHFQACRDYPKAVQCLKLVARTCASRHALPEALDAVNKAIGLTESLPEPAKTLTQLDLIEQLGLAYRLMGQLSLSAAEFERMAERARDAGETGLQIRAQLWLASVLSWVNRERCLDAANTATLLCTSELPPQLVQNVQGQAAYWNLLFRRWDERDAVASAAALEAARQSGDRGALALQASRHSFFQALSSEYGAARQTAKEAVQIAAAIESLLDYSIAHYFEAWALLHSGEWGQLQQRLGSAIELAERNGHELWVLLFGLLEQFLHLQAFHFDSARDACREYRDRARKLGHPLSEQISLVLLGLAELGKGNLKDARRSFETLRAWQNRERILMDWIWKMPLQFGFTELCLSENNVRAARKEADVMLSVVSTTAERTWIGLAHYLRARVSIAEGNDHDARSEVVQGLAAIEGWEAPVAAWRLHSLAARIQLGGGHREEAQRAILGLARSLPDEDKLKVDFLSSPPIREILQTSHTADA